MVFDSAIAKVPAPDQHRIRVRLTTIGTASPVGRQIEANIGLEARLPLDVAREIVGGFLATQNQAEELREKYTELCDAHVLRGPEIQGVRPKVLGRAVVVDRLCATLVRRHGFRTVAQAEAWLKRQCKLDPAALRSRFTDVALGGKVIWATFREPNRDADPFSPVPTRADMLHDALGLDQKLRGQPLLLFIYAPPAGLALHVPTIADAGWGRLFRPAIADPECLCGLTAPPTDDPNIKPLPETVHAQIFGDTLTAPLRIVR